jgi:hypothetical protein
MAERYQAWCEKNAERGGGERRGKWYFLSEFWALKYIRRNKPVY